MNTIDALVVTLGILAATWLIHRAFDQVHGEIKRLTGSLVMSEVFLAERRVVHQDTLRRLESEQAVITELEDTVNRLQEEAQSYQTDLQYAEEQVEEFEKQANEFETWHLEALAELEDSQQALEACHEDSAGEDV